MSTFLARVYVTLRPTVNDPQGLTIRGGLHLLGFTSVDGVRAGKYLEISFEEQDEETANNKIEEMCNRLLANPVIEQYRFELDRVQPS